MSEFNGPGRIICPTETVIEDWIDYNGHLNMAFYNVIFDRAIGSGHMEFFFFGWIDKMSERLIYNISSIGKITIFERRLFKTKRI